MNQFSWIRKFGKVFLIFTGMILFLTFFMTLFHYFNLIPYSVLTVMKFVIPVLSFFLGGFLLSKNSKEKGWLEGIKGGSFFLFLIILIRLIFIRNRFSIADSLYYFILLFASMLGGMIGIHFTSNEK